MRKLTFSTTLLFIALILCSGCAKVQVKDTPAIIGEKGTLSTSLDKYYDLKDATKEADIVAEVEIEQWCGEMNEPLEKTIFNAKIIKSLKNNIDPDMSDVKILQLGNSSFTVKDYPLFKRGDRFIVFLKKTIGMDEIDNTFWILGEYSTILEIAEFEGSYYCMKMFGDYPEIKSLEVDENDSVIKKALEKIETEKIAGYSKYPEFTDKVKSSYIRRFAEKHVFMRESIITELEKLLEGKE